MPDDCEHCEEARRLCGCGDELSGVLGAKCGNCQAADLTTLEAERDRLRAALAGVVGAWNDCTPPADLEQYLTPWLARAKRALGKVTPRSP